MSGAWAYVYREGRLKPGDRVSVVGRASLKIDPAARGQECARRR